MAVTTKEIKSHYPLPVYNYRVDIGADTIAFSEVSGLEISLDTITYKESQTAANVVGPNQIYMPGIPKPLTITLKKGLVLGKSVPTLYGWIHDIKLNTIDKRDITVHLCDETGASVVQWVVYDAFPTKLSAPSFNAGSNEVAIESLELMASRMEIKGGN